MAGPFDSNPTAISRQQVSSWVDQHLIEYLGDLHDVKQALASCKYYVLPSYYREGIPRSILEALATARPIITTDTPGCRETVVDGINGYIVSPRNSFALAETMLRLIRQSDAESQRMSLESLKLAREISLMLMQSIMRCLKQCIYD